MTMEPTKKTNPYGANQHQLDPRQKLCWENYINPKSETFGNARQSALKVGYEEYYADTITSTGWFSDKVRRLNLLSKAEKVLEDTLNYESVNPDGKVRVDLLRVQTDVAKHVTSTLGKNEGYSSRNELTGADGEPLGEIDPEDKAKRDALINSILNAKSGNTKDIEGKEPQGA